MKFPTTRFGMLEIPDEEILHFPLGVFGFSLIQRYVIVTHNLESPLKWLQAIDKADLAFPILPTAELGADYSITISPEDLSALRLESAADGITFVILMVPKDAPDQATANLRAPIVINTTAHLARQILAVEEYPIRYLLAEGQPATVECAG